MPEDSTPFFDPTDETVIGLSPGQVVFGRFRIDRLVGRGAMGMVYLAHDQELDEPVALKFLPQVVVHDRVALDSMVREVKQARQLTHQNIVRIHDLVRADRMAAIAMEWVEGRTLGELRLERESRVLEVEDLDPLLPQLCAALDYAHQEARIVHRDIKPSNILVTTEGKVKITDFGIARSLSDTMTQLTAQSTSGTPSYMSPQQLMGKRAQAADDIYALGATLFEMLAGKPPFYSGDIGMQILHTVPESMTSRRAELGVAGQPIPEAWERMVARCLEKEPENRPGSAGEIAGQGAEREGERAEGPGLDLDEEATVVMPVGGGIGVNAGKSEGNKVSTSQDSGEGGGSTPGDSREGGDSPRRTPSARRGKGRRFWVAGVFLLAGVLGVLGWQGWERGWFSDEEPKDAVVVEKPVVEFDEEPEAAPVVEAGEAFFMVEVDPADVGARVWLGSHSAVEVDGRGRLRLPEVAPGERELVVQAPGYQTFVSRVDVGEDGSGMAEVRLVPVKGSLRVVSNPGAGVSVVDFRGASINVGVIPRGGELAVDDLLNIGDYTVRIGKERYQSFEAPVELAVGRTARVEHPLVPNPGTLRVFSVPDGGEVQVRRGERTVATGETPFSATVPAEAALEVQVRRAGYRTENRQVQLDPEERRTLDLGTLVAESGGLEIRVRNAGFNPAGLEVEIDGARAEYRRTGTGLRVEGLETGRREVFLRHPDYLGARAAVTVQDGRVSAYEVELTPLPGAVTVEVAGPRPGTWRLEVDGRRVDAESGNRYRLPAGQSLSLEVVAEGWQGSSQTLTLAANEQRRVRFSLEEVRGPAAGRDWTVPEVGMEFVWIAAMNMWVGKYEVTNAEFRRFRSGHNSGYFERSNRRHSLNGERQPVVQVSYEDAVAFCEWLTRREREAGRLPAGYRYRLPDGDEWTRYARCGTNREYPWGNSMPPTRGNYADETAKAEIPSFSVISGYRDGHAVSAPVEQSWRNEWGLYGVGGNVWEWTSEQSGSSRVLRGASWFSFVTDFLRVESRSSYRPSYRYYYYGFRVVLVGG